LSIFQNFPEFSGFFRAVGKKVAILLIAVLTEKDQLCTVLSHNDRHFATAGPAMTAKQT
jgi:hypothetical protein